MQGVWPQWGCLPFEIQINNDMVNTLYEGGGVPWYTQGNSSNHLRILLFEQSQDTSRIIRTVYVDGFVINND